MQPKKTTDFFTKKATGRQAGGDTIKKPLLDGGDGGGISLEPTGMSDGTYNSSADYVNFDLKDPPQSQTKRVSVAGRTNGFESKAEVYENKTDAELVSKDFEQYEWDLLLVVPSSDHKSNKDLEVSILPEDIYERLTLSGLQTFIFFSVDKSKIFIKVRAPLKRLMEEAEGTGFYLKLDEKYLRDRVDFYDAPIIHDDTITPLQPYEFIYSKYELERSYMFSNAPFLKHPFSPTIRTKLILSIIQSSGEQGCHLNVRKLIAEGSMLAVFPLHDDRIRKQLQKNWFGWSVHPWRQPIDDIKDYFGEKIALYFEFMGHYTTWLLALGLLGVLVSITIFAEAGYYHSFARGLDLGYFIPVFCLFVSFWAQFMLEYWKRKEATKSQEWGMGEFEETETTRAEYFGEVQNSVVNGKKEKYFSSEERTKRVLYSGGIITCMILLVIACVSLIFYLQVEFSISNNNFLRDYGNILVSVFSSIQIAVLGNYYNDLAVRLTDQENHKTDTDYDDALIAKLYGFSFINSYASLFYLAFIKSSVQSCTNGCFADLSLQLTIIFVTKIFVDKIQRILQNVVLTKYEEHKFNKELAAENKKDTRSASEKEFLLENSDPQMGVLEDFNEMATQFGYVTLFVGACPLAPILAYASNWLEIRSDGYRLLFLSRRALPLGVEDIGTWQAIFQLTAFVAVTTNAGLVCFAMKVLNVDPVTRVWIFIIAQYFVFLIMSLFGYYVDDVPLSVTIQLERQEYLSELAHMDKEEREASRGTQSFKDVNVEVQNLHIYNSDDS